MVYALPELRSYDRGDGACVHLTDDNLCSIYDQRPSVCRVDDAQPAVMTPQEWHRRNHDACGRLHLQVYGQELVR